MNYEKKEGDLVIFKNKEKKSEKSPEYWGTLRLNSEDLKVALWVKEGKNGKFMAGMVTIPDGRIVTISDAPMPDNDSLAIEIAEPEELDDLPF
jgi:hypothetical protein